MYQSVKHQQIKDKEEQEEYVKVNVIECIQKNPMKKKYANTTIKYKNLSKGMKKVMKKVYSEGVVASNISYDDIYEYSMNQQTYSYDVTAYDGEGQIISALESVVTNNDVLVCTLTGHGEQELGANATSSLTKGNYKLQSLNLKELLMVYNKKLGKWLQPGGHIENGETPLSSKYAILCVKSLVFPLPAPAVTNTAPFIAKRACFCSSFKSFISYFFM